MPLSSGNLGGPSINYVHGEECQPSGEACPTNKEDEFVTAAENEPFVGRSYTDGTSYSWEKLARWRNLSEETN
jgi:hypothetical protein